MVALQGASQQLNVSKYPAGKEKDNHCDYEEPRRRQRNLEVSTRLPGFRIRGGPLMVEQPKLLLGGSLPDLSYQISLGHPFRPSG
jgi:hypothetical protein